MHGLGRALIAPAQVDFWLKEAKPGAELPYATGFQALAAAGADLCERLQVLQSGGYVYLKQRRVEHGAGFLYVAERSSRPLSAKPLHALAGGR